MSGLRAPALAAAIVLMAAPSAHAACEERADIRQDDPTASLAIGDSVMLAAAKQLAAYGFSVDAQSCRRFDQGLAILRQRELPDLVVIALGSNATVSANQIESVLALLGPYARLVFVLPRALGGGPDPDGKVMRAAAEAYPDQVSVLDWPAHSAAHDEWFAPDGLHLTGAGARAFADFVAESGSVPPEAALGPPPAAAPPEVAKPPRPKPREPSRSPTVVAMWRALGRKLAGALAPAAAFLEQVVGGWDTAAAQDL